MKKCGPKPPRYLLDSFTIKKILKERGPMSWHELMTQACAEGVDVTTDFDSAVISALGVGFIKARFEVCTPEEESAFCLQGIRPTIQTLTAKLVEYKSSDGRDCARIEVIFPDMQNKIKIRTFAKKIKASKQSPKTNRKK